MTDPRRDVDRLRAQWLNLLARVRANAGSITAEEHAVRVRAARSGDPALTDLADALRTKRGELDATIGALERRVAEIGAVSTGLADAHVATVVAGATAAKGGARSGGAP